MATHEKPQEQVLEKPVQEEPKARQRKLKRAFTALVRAAQKELEHHSIPRNPGEENDWAKTFDVWFHGPSEQEVTKVTCTGPVRKYPGDLIMVDTYHLEEGLPVETLHLQIPNRVDDCTEDKARSLGLRLEDLNAIRAIINRKHLLSKEETMDAYTHFLGFRSDQLPPAVAISGTK